jgi:Protein of unknown function (DUF1064)
MGSWRNVGHHKYGARATVSQGIRFQSKAEARRYDELILLERAGAIRELERQPAYPITVEGRDFKRRIVAVYVADFRYRDGPAGILTVEDVKGVRTPVYKLKKKLVEAQYGIEITEIGPPDRSAATGRANRSGPVRHRVRANGRSPCARQ